MMSRQNVELVHHLVGSNAGLVTTDQNNTQNEEQMVDCIVRECAAVGLALASQLGIKIFITVATDRLEE